MKFRVRITTGIAPVTTDPRMMRHTVMEVKVTALNAIDALRFASGMLTPDDWSVEISVVAEKGSSP